LISRAIRAHRSARAGGRELSSPDRIFGPSRRTSVVIAKIVSRVPISDAAPLPMLSAGRARLAPNHDRHRPAAPFDPPLRVPHQRVQDHRQEQGDRDHQQEVEHPVGDLAGQVDGDHHAAEGEDRRQRDAAGRG
jgi:hypothetical protein